jgi:hypothetical protein
MKPPCKAQLSSLLPPQSADTCYDWNVLATMMTMDCLGCLITINAWHAEIHQHQSRLELNGEFDCLNTA